MAEGSEQAQEEGPANAWKFFVALGIVVLAVVGFSVYQSYSAKRAAEHNRFNGFDFTPVEGGLWAVQVQEKGQPYVIPFYYHPRDTTDVVVHQGVLDPVLRNPEQIFISVDPDEGALPVVAGVEISRLTGNKYNILNIPTRGALSRQPATHVEIPIVTCDDASNSTTVIQLVHDPTANAIVSDGNCVILFYKDANESVRVADRYAYMLLRII